MEPDHPTTFRSGERLFAVLLLCGLTAFALWGIAGGWRNRSLPGNAFRQTQTAITALFVQREHNFSLAYPTPVLGKPWSVPFEFPLYQWTVAVVSDTTGLGLIKCGRLVSAVCFFLGLPALWLLLGRMGLPWVRRAVAMGMVLTCPLLIFYARAFLIETMALMFALWFLAAFVAAVEKRSIGWLVVANVAGIGAGLVKVTTFMVYLVPAAAWALWWLWREWRGADKAGGGRREWRGLARLVGWVAAATALPFAATYGWIVFSDRTKALSPGARGLVSSTLHAYNFGTWANRTDPAIWAAHWRTFSVEVVPVATMAALAVVALLRCRGRALWWMLGCLALCALAPVTFPVLYAWHEYYFTAVAVLPMAAAGIALGTLLDDTERRWRAWVAIVAVIGMQIHAYATTFRPQQLEEPRGSSDLAESLRYTTEKDDVLIIAGEDWNSITPFYAQRRALMLRRDMERDLPYVEESFANLAGERVAALVLRGAQRENRQLLEMVADRFGIDPNPVFRWRDGLVYVQGARVGAVLARLAQMGLPEIDVVRAANPAVPAETVVWEAEYMTERQKMAFLPMGSPPLRYLSQFGVGPGQLDGRAYTGTHPTTRIWFAAAVGRRDVTVEFVIAPNAYTDVRREDATDGVEFVVAAARGDAGRRVLFSRLLNPFDEPADRGWQKETVKVELEAGEALVLETLPGPEGNLNRDWCGWGRVEIR